MQLLRDNLTVGIICTYNNWQPVMYIVGFCNLMIVIADSDNYKLITHK